MNIVVDIFVWMAYVVSLYFTIFLVLVYFDKRTLFKQERSSTALKKYPLISVLVPAYNEEEHILRTLESIEALDYPKQKLDVIVINDGSTDRTKEVIETYIRDKPHFTIITHSNRGKAASLNRALQQARGEFFACLDADSFVEPLTLRKMLAFYDAQADPALAIVTPAMKVYNPTNFLQKIQWLEYIVMIFIGRLSSHLDSLYVAPGPFSLYRTDIIKQLDGFDEHTLTEDQEIAYRIQQHHFKIRQCFDGYVYTVAPPKIKSFYQQRRRWYLGSVTCLHQYRKMVGNKEYGDFGVMQMVKNVTGFCLAVLGIGVVGYLFFIPFVEKIKTLFLINFNLLPYFTHLKFQFNFLDFLTADFKKGFILFSLWIIGLFFFYQAHKNAQERMTKFGWLPLLPYAVFYYLFKGIILLVALFEFGRGKKIKW